MRLSASHADRVIFISEFFRDLFVSSDWCQRSRAEMIYLGRERDDSADTRDLPGIDEFRPFALCVSHLYPYKRLANLIEGYAAQEQYLSTIGLRLLIVGKTVHRGEYTRLQRLISGYGLNHMVRLYGEIPQDAVAGLMRRAEFFVFQSTCENCPSTLIEALASELPIACSSAGVMPEIAGPAARYFDPFDPADIGRALVELATDQGLRETLSRKSARQARKYPTWDGVAASAMDVLRSVAKANDACAV
jgi:glycosyltransferase involved in cell wall biosynthesis